MIFKDTYETIIKSVSMLEGVRRQFAFGIILCILISIFEILNVGLIFPFLSLVINPELVLSNHYTNYIYKLLNFQTTKEFIIVSGLIILIVIIILNYLIYYKTKYLTNFAVNQMTQTSNKILTSYINKPIVYHVNSNTGNMSKDIIGQSDAFTNQVLIAITSIISEGFALFALIVFLVIIDPIGTLLTMIFMSLGVGLLINKTKIKIIKYGKLNDKVNEKRFVFVISSLQAIKEIKTYAKEKEFVDSFAKISNEMSFIYSKLTILQQLPSFIIQTFAPCLVICMSLYYVYFDENLQNVIPKIAIFAVVGFRIIPYLTKFVNSIATIRQNKVVVENLYDLLKIRNVSKQLRNIPIKNIPLIEFKNVNYTYENSDLKILKNINLTIGPNTFMAIVGESGAGKTTLIDLLLGLYTPESGEILLDGLSISEFNRLNLAKIFGYVHQTPLILDASIMENIAFGISKEKIDHSKIQDIIKKVHLDSFLKTTGKTIFDRVGERGALLSGGQRQRIGIARALYIDPKILILDESTNSLDGATEIEIINTIKKLKDSASVIAVAHSKAILINCDRIIMFKNGEIVADGNFDELQKSSGEFNSLMAQSNKINSTFNNY